MAAQLDLTGKLLEACKYGSLEMIKNILADRPKEINTPVCGMPLICRVARLGHMNILEWLLAQRITFRNATNKLGNTALACACFNQRIPAVKLLIKSKAGVDIPNNLGNSPLHHAALKGYWKVALILLRGGANANSKDLAGNSALHICCSNGHYEVARLLIRNGADPSITNQEGDTALHSLCDFDSGAAHITFMQHQLALQSSAPSTCKQMQELMQTFMISVALEASKTGTLTPTHLECADFVSPPDIDEDQVAAVQDVLATVDPVPTSCAALFRLVNQALLDQHARNAVQKAVNGEVLDKGDLKCAGLEMRMMVRHYLAIGKALENADPRPTHAWQLRHIADPALAASIMKQACDGKLAQTDLIAAGYTDIFPAHIVRAIAIAVETASRGDNPPSNLAELKRLIDRSMELEGLFQKVMQRVTTGGYTDPSEIEAIGMQTLLSGSVTLEMAKATLKDSWSSGQMIIADMRSILEKALVAKLVADARMGPKARAQRYLPGEIEVDLKAVGLVNFPSLSVVMRVLQRGSDVPVTASSLKEKLNDCMKTLGVKVGAECRYNYLKLGAFYKTKIIKVNKDGTVDLEFVGDKGPTRYSCGKEESVTGITNIDPTDTDNFSIVDPPSAGNSINSTTAVDLLTMQPTRPVEKAKADPKPKPSPSLSSSGPFVEWVAATEVTINPDNKTYYIRCWTPPIAYRGFGDTDVKHGLVPAVRLWRLEEAIAAGAVALSVGWRRIWNNEHCAVYLPIPPPGFTAIGLVTAKMNAKERWRVPEPDTPVLCIDSLSSHLKEGTPFTIKKHVWHSRKTETTPFKLHRLRHGLVWPEPSPFGKVVVPEAQVLNREVLEDTRVMVDRILMLTPGQVASRADPEKDPLNPALEGLPEILEGVSATQLDAIHEALESDRHAVPYTEDLESLISFALLRVHGAQLIIDCTTERAEAAAAALAGNPRFSAALEAKTALKPEMLANAGVNIPVDAHLCEVVQDQLERRVAPYAAVAKEDSNSDMRFSATSSELEVFIDSVVATSIVDQVRSTKHWRTTRLIRHADLKAAGLPDNLPPTLVDVVQTAIATTPEPPQTLLELRELGFSALRARAVSVARSGALQQRDLVVAGLNPRRTLTEYQLKLVSEALAATKTVAEITMESFVDQVLVLNVIANARAGKLTSQILEAVGIEQFACSCHLKVAEEILETDNMTLNTKNKRGDTCLHRVTKANALKLANRLLDHYPMIDIQNNEGDTPLHIAVRHDHRDFIQELESRGAITSPQNSDGDTVLHLAIRQNMSDVALLFKNNPVPEKLQLRNKDNLTAMDMIAAANMMDLARALTEDLCDNVQYSTQIETFYQDNSLMSAREHAAQNKHVRMVTFIHSVQRKLAEKCLNMHGSDDDDTEETDLNCIQAILKELPGLIDEYVYYSKTPSATDERETFFMRNATRPETLKWLLETYKKRKPTTLDLQTDSGVTALHKAAARSPECAALLVEAKACINIRTNQGALYGGLGTPFHYAMKSTRHSSRMLHSVVCMLLDAGAHINQSMVDGNTPLHLAVEGNQEDTVAELLQREPNFDAKNKSELTPLMIASKESYVDIVKLLLEAGADVGIRDNLMRGALYWAVRGLVAREPGELDHMECVKMIILGKADVDMLDIHGDTALHWAALSCYRRTVKRQATALDMIASQTVPRSYPKIATLLLNHKATIDVQNRRGNTALHRAAASYDVTMVRLLVEAGADPEIVNSKSVQVSWQLDAARPQKPAAVARANPSWDAKKLPHVIQWNLARRKLDKMDNKDIVSYLSGIRGVASRRTHQLTLTAIPGLHSTKMLSAATSPARSARLIDSVNQQAARLASFKKRIERIASCALPLRVVKIRDAGSIITLAGTEKAIRAVKEHFKTEREVPCEGGLVRVQTQIARRQDQSKAAAAEYAGRAHGSAKVQLLRVPGVKGGHQKSFRVELRALLRLTAVKFRTVKVEIIRQELVSEGKPKKQMLLAPRDVEVDVKGTGGCQNFSVVVKQVTKHTRICVILSDEYGLTLAQATISRDNLQYFVRSKHGKVTARQHVTIFRWNTDENDAGTLSNEQFGVAVISVYHPEFASESPKHLVEVAQRSLGKMHKLVDNEVLTADIAKQLREQAKLPTRILRFLVRRMVAGEYVHDEISDYREAVVTRADMHLIQLRAALYDLRTNLSRSKGKGRSPLFYAKYCAKHIVSNASSAAALLANLKYDVQGYMPTTIEHRKMEIMELRCERQLCHISLYFQLYAGLFRGNPRRAEDVEKLGQMQLALVASVRRFIDPLKNPPTLVSEKTSKKVLPLPPGAPPERKRDRVKGEPQDKKKAKAKGGAAHDKDKDKGAPQEKTTVKLKGGAAEIESENAPPTDSLEAVTLVAQSVMLPSDAVDVTDLDAAKAEIARYRSAVRKYKHLLVPRISNFPWNCSGRNNPVYDALKPSDYLKAVQQPLGPHGYTFDQAIQCCIDSTRGSGGMAIPDEESYKLWKEWYDKAVDTLHGHPPNATHTTDLDDDKVDIKKLPQDLDHHCVSVLVSISRNVEGFALPPAITREERRAVEKVLKAALKILNDQFPGTYFPFPHLNQEQRARLENNPLLSPYLEAPAPDTSIAHSGGARDWPDARGMYITKDKKLVILLNRDDHIQFKCIKGDGDIGSAIKLCMKACCEFGKILQTLLFDWMFDVHLGHFTSSLSNVGTGMSVSVQLKLPSVVVKQTGKPVLKKYCKALHLDCVEARLPDHFHISNLQRIGRTEVQLAQTLIDGVCDLLEIGKTMQQTPDIAKTAMMVTIEGPAAALNRLLPGCLDGCKAYNGTLHTKGHHSRCPNIPITVDRALLVRALHCIESKVELLRVHASAAGESYSHSALSPKSGMQVLSALHHAQLVQQHLDAVVNPLLFVTEVLDRSSPFLEHVEHLGLDTVQHGLRSYPLYRFDCGSAQHELAEFRDLEKLPGMVEFMHEDQNQHRLLAVKKHLCALVHESPSVDPEALKEGMSVLVWNGSEVEKYGSDGLLGVWLAGKATHLPGTVYNVGDKSYLVSTEKIHFVTSYTHDRKHPEPSSFQGLVSNTQTPKYARRYVRVMKLWTRVAVYLAELMVAKGHYPSAQSNASQALEAFRHLAPFDLSRDQFLEHLLLMRLDLLCRFEVMKTTSMAKDQRHIAKHIQSLLADFEAELFFYFLEPIKIDLKASSEVVEEVRARLDLLNSKFVEKVKEATKKNSYFVLPDWKAKLGNDKAGA